MVSPCCAYGSSWLQGFSWQEMIFLTPLFFGVCHLHHLWGLTKQCGFTLGVVALCMLQFLYTTVFGWYAVWVLLSTGSVVAAMLVHGLCNLMGLPPFHRMERASLVLCAVGVAAFAWAAPRVLRPSIHSSFWWQQCCSTLVRLQHPAQLVTTS